MSHEALRDRLLDLAYGELAPREAARVEEHAKGCVECRAELARIREARRLVAALPVEPAPEHGERILLAAAREAASGRKARRRPPPWLLGASVVAASLVAVVAVSWRIAELRRGSLERPDANALLGERVPEPGPPASPLVPEPPRREAETAAPRLGAASAAKGSEPATRPAPERQAAPARPSPGGAPGGEEPRVSGADQRFARAPPAPAVRAGPAPETAGPAPEPAESRDLAAGAAAADEAPAPGREARRAAPSLRAPSAAVPSPASSAPRAGRRERASEGQEAAIAAAPTAGGGEAREWYAELREAGRLRGEIRTFPACEGEAWRKVETDPEGRVVRYVREGRIGGRRLRVEHLYGPGGALGAVTVRDLDRPGESLEAEEVGLGAPARAEDASIDAPPRCAR